MQSAAPTAAPASASARSPASRAAACTPPQTLQARISVSNAAYAAQSQCSLRRKRPAALRAGPCRGQHTCEHVELWTAGLLPLPYLFSPHQLFERLRGPVEHQGRRHQCLPLARKLCGVHARTCSFGHGRQIL
jgi:hypothetical protein